jgi:ATP-dependent protease ClpP protease subunit
MSVNKQSVAEYREFLAESGMDEEIASVVLRSKCSQQNRRAPGIIKLEAAEDGKSAELMIYDYIGFDPWSGTGVTAKGIAEQLKAIGTVDQITVKINSGGGDVFDAMAIYQLLKQNGSPINVEIDGLAASAASFIAMVGDSISIATGGMMMVHNSMGGVLGNASDMLAMAGLLEKIDGQIASIYAARSGRKAETFRKMMTAETWLTGQEAVDAKLATAVMPNKKAAAMAFDLSGFRNAPKIEAPPEPEPEPNHRPADEAIAARLRVLEVAG